jgi:Mn2+/Fe2+ NRAMP family transporter
MTFKKLISLLGPGLLYAGAAIGVSHLVQSTRAGSDYYFDLLWILILANALKYPFFEFGPRYASATGKNLIEGYRQVGRWAVILFAAFTVITMFAIQAAVTVVTAGIAGQVFHLDLGAPLISAIILGSTILILIIGKYWILDRLIKAVILILALSTIIAVTSALFSSPVEIADTSGQFDWKDSVDIFFLIAFIGWMPAPIDISVWQSLWTLAKKESSKRRITWKESRLDFNIGYIGTAILAIGFLTLGAKIMFGSGEQPAADGIGFAKQLISMYTTTIGDWSYSIIAIAALTTMYSTTLTVIDAIPRTLEALTTRTLAPGARPRPKTYRLYWGWLILLAIGSLILLTFFSTSMRFMVDLATTLSFITAPVLAYLNLRVVTHSHLPATSRPEGWLRIWAWIGLVFLTCFTIFYLIYRIIHIF